MVATTKVEANIFDQFEYVLGHLYGFEIGSLNYEKPIIENLSQLEWDKPLYDDSQPSYNLSFKAAKTTDTPAGTFSINHKATGQFTDPSIEQFDVQNGTLTDTVTATYGTLDKVTNTDSKTQVSTLDKNGEIVNSKYTHIQNFVITNSNDTPDKSDDFTYTNSSNYSNSFVAKTGIKSATQKANYVYKSKNYNYSVSQDEKTDDKSGSDGALDGSTGSQSFKITYSNHNLYAQNTITAKLAITDSYKYVGDNRNDTQIFSSVDIKSAADDKSSLSSLNFSGEIKTIDDVITANLKSFTLETTELKFISGAIKTDIPSESYSALSSLQDIYHLDDLSPQEIINNLIYTFKDFNEADNTITIKSSEGTEIYAGGGKDVVVGGIGDDTIIGGAGSDKLTGGKGLDTFKFALSDFISENANGESVFNKSADTITDFNLKDGDVLDFGEMGQLGFYKTLNDAKADDAQLFYVKGQIYYNVDTTGEKYTPTVVITLTGNPALNAEGTDFNYPSV